MEMWKSLFVSTVCTALVNVALAFPDEGKWTFTQINQDNGYVHVSKSLYAGSKVYITVHCSSKSVDKRLNIGWTLRRSPCYQRYIDIDQETLIKLFVNSQTQSRRFNEDSDKVIEIGNAVNEKCSAMRRVSGNSQNVEQEDNSNKAPPQQQKSDEVQPADNASAAVEKKTNADGERQRRRRRGLEQGIDGYDNGQQQKQQPHADTMAEHKHLHNEDDDNRMVEVTSDGVYLLVLKIDHGTLTSDLFDYNVTLEIEMKGDHGYLSAVDWPLLPFYGAMCLVYVIYGLAWLFVSFCQWRDLLRIQFWIGGVILLGMLEKAMFYAEYQNINSTGTSVRGAVLFAELVSCGKRTLARMLVVIVSLGFGIVKPRLGPVLHRVVAVGGLYFLLAAVESCLRVSHTTNDPTHEIFLAGIPLSVLDSAICWWIFMGLKQTIRTLQVRRNHVKLTLYKHFTNTLIFSVLASVAFMLWSIKYHKLTDCITDWKELWVDDAFWHLLFSVLLLVIMILWRPTNNNQRYAFSPLLDNPEDEEDELMTHEAFEGMKARNVNRSGERGNSNHKLSNAIVLDDDDDLKWVEENIPSGLGDSALPVLDSEEEILTTKFEMSKME